LDRTTSAVLVEIFFIKRNEKKEKIVDRLVYSNTLIGPVFPCILAAFMDVFTDIRRLPTKSPWLLPPAKEIELASGYLAGRAYQVNCLPPVGMTPMGRAPPPEQDLKFQEIVADVLPKEVIEEVRQGYRVSVTKPQTTETTDPILQGSSHLQNLTTIHLGDTDDDYIRFLNSDECIYVTGVIGATINYNYSGTKPGEFKQQVVPPPQFTAPDFKEKTCQMEVSPGGPADAGVDIAYGTPTGQKAQHCLPSKQLLIATVNELGIRMEKLKARKGKLVEVGDYLELLNNFFLDDTWDGFIYAWTKLFEKSEVIKITKVTRLIWACGLFSFIMDKIVYQKMHLSKKFWLPHHFTHGYSAKGGGLQHLVMEAAQHMSERIDYMGDDFLCFLATNLGVPITGNKEKDMARLVSKSMIAADDDIRTWDLSVHGINFTAFDFCVSYGYGYGETEFDDNMCILIALQCLSNFYSTTNYVLIKKRDGLTPTFIATAGVLASGTFNTAYAGSFIHKLTRVMRCVILAEILSALLTVVQDPHTKLIKYTLLGQKEYTHSDDFLSFLLSICAPYLAMMDNVLFYAKYQHMCLKFENNAGYEFSPEFKPSDLISKLSVELIDRYELMRGTDEGQEFFPHYLLNPVTLFSPNKRLEKMFKNVYSKIVFDQVSPFGRIVDNGAQFLQQNVLFIPLGTRGTCDGTWIYPFRAVGRLVAKLYFLANRRLTPPEMLLRITAFGFLCVGNEPLHKAIGEIYNRYKDYHRVSSLQLANAKLDDKKYNDWKHKLGEIEEIDAIQYPTYARVIEFFSLSEDKNNYLYRLSSNPDRTYYPGNDFMEVNRSAKKRRINSDILSTANKQVRDIMARALKNGGKVPR